MRRLRYCLSVGHRARSACCGALRCASSVTTRAEGAESAGPGNERGAASAPGTLSFEQAVKLSIGGLGQIAIPDALERGLSKALKGQGKTSLQGAARALQKQLRARAATRQRGGTVDIADVGMWRSPVPRRRDVDDDDIAEVEEDVRERLALEGVSMLDDRLGVVDVRQQRRVLREERKEKLLEYRRVAARPGRDTPYESTETKAYAAQRLPATYAACCRVLSEIRTRAPKFRPSRVLDFGAGPGAATWAVQDTWGAAAVEDALLVEPALAMMQLGRMIEGERAADVEAAGVMPAPSKQALEQRPCAPRTTLRWLAALPKMRDHKTGRSNKRKHDLVIASYVLAEVRTAPRPRSAHATIPCAVGSATPAVAPAHLTGRRSTTRASGSASCAISGPARRTCSSS
ncbi:unnamed protein product [Pedinophyceae sp. YPF-701]|nr:unnamed protein product [Pedinophyceae sp. YPF-701]